VRIDQRALQIGRLNGAPSGMKLRILRHDLLLRMLEPPPISIDSACARSVL
jgi:hypothetical protein